MVNLIRYACWRGYTFKMEVWEECILLFNTVLARVNDTQKHNITEWLKVCFDIARRILYFIVWAYISLWRALIANYHSLDQVFCELLQKIAKRKAAEEVTNNKEDKATKKCCVIMWNHSPEYSKCKPFLLTQPPTSRQLRIFLFRRCGCACNLQESLENKFPLPSNGASDVVFTCVYTMVTF